MEVPFTEDLIAEHGILNRILLVYEELISLLKENSKKPNIIQYAHESAQLIRTFVEDYHEKLEEDYVFPLFKDKGYDELISTLIQQHSLGRILTDKILSSTESGELIDNMSKFIYMYRAHESREDTIVFRNVRKFIDAEKFHELSKKFDEIEDEKLGPHGYNNILKKVIKIEQGLGLGLKHYSTAPLEN